MDDTQIGGPQRAFPITLWSTILQAKGTDPVVLRATLEKLLANYWKPVFACIRFGWNKSVEEAKDSAQDFFLDFLERDFLKDVDPSKGRFRSFLKGALKNFMMNEKRDAARLKRGGGRAIVPIEELANVQAAPGEPDQVFDSEWLKSVLARGIDALRDELAKAGKASAFRVFELYDLGGVAEPSYRLVAQETGLSESDVRNCLHLARQTLRRILIRQVSEYALDEHDVEEEMRWILG